MQRVRDNQRQRVYNWERHTLCIWDYPTIEMPEVKKLVKRISDRYQLAVPEVGYGQGAVNASYRSEHKVVFPCWARTIPVVCHEMAHAVTARVHWGRAVAAHGKEFVRIYMDTLVWQEVATIEALINTAREFRIDFAAPDNCKPRVLRKKIR